MSDDLSIDKLVGEIKSRGGFVTKEDLDAVPKGDGKSSPEEFVKHMNSCTNDGCAIHKAMSEKERAAMLKGFGMGTVFGKRNPGFVVEE